MGKHDKAEVISCEVKPDEYYKERIEKLEKQRNSLLDLVRDRNAEVARLELILEEKQLTQTGIANEYEELLKEKDERIAKLERALIEASIR